MHPHFTNFSMLFLKPYLTSNYNTHPAPRNIPAVYLHLLLLLLLVPLLLISSWLLGFSLLCIANTGWSVLFDLILPLCAVLLSAAVFLTRNPMHALLSLVGVFFSAVLFYTGAGIEFIGLVFLIVYVGAVAVLFLFVIMLLNVKSLTSTERLIQHFSQVLAIVAGASLYVQLNFRTMEILGVSIARIADGGASLAQTAAEAVAVYVRFQASDIGAITPLYTQHSALFLLTTAILLVALMGAIIMATVTTEKPIKVSTVRPLTAALRTFGAPALFTCDCSGFPATLRTFLSKYGDAAMAIGYVLCLFLVGFFVLTIQPETVVGDDGLTIVVLHHFAAALPSRKKARMSDVRYNYFRRTRRCSVTRGAWEPYIGKKWTGLHWVYGLQQRLAEQRFNLKTLGLRHAVKYVYNVHVVPYLYYYSRLWQLYLPLFLLLIVCFGVFSVPIPWFLDDYDVVWRDLVALYKNIRYHVGISPWINHYCAGGHAPTLVLTVLTLLLLYPVAVVNVIICDETFQTILFWALMYTSLFYSAHHGTLGIHCRHRAACLRIKNETANLKRAAAVFRELERESRERHPDKGRKDFIVLLTLIVPDPATASLSEFFWYCLQFSYNHAPAHSVQLSFIFLLCGAVYGAAGLIHAATAQSLYKRQLHPMRKILVDGAVFAACSFGLYALWRVLNPADLGFAFMSSPSDAPRPLLSVITLYAVRVFCVLFPIWACTRHWQWYLTVKAPVAAGRRRVLKKHIFKHLHGSRIIYLKRRAFAVGAFENDVFKQRFIGVIRPGGALKLRAPSVYLPRLADFRDYRNSKKKVRLLAHLRIIRKYKWRKRIKKNEN